MPLLLQYNIGKVEVHVWKITETVEELLGVVPAVYAPCISRFKSRDRMVQWLAVRAIIARRFGGSVRIAYDAAGKPVLEGAEGCVTLSHTDGYAVLAYSRDGDIGVDVELQSRNVLRVADRFMHTGSLDSFQLSDRNLVALLHWCAKEALYKIVGDLGGNFKDNISVDGFELRDEGRVSLHLVGLDDGGVRDYVVHYSILEELLVVLCYKQDV